MIQALGVIIYYLHLENVQNNGTKALLELPFYVREPWTIIALLRKFLRTCKEPNLRSLVLQSRKTAIPVAPGANPVGARELAQHHEAKFLYHYSKV